MPSSKRIRTVTASANFPGIRYSDTDTSSRRADDALSDVGILDIERVEEHRQRKKRERKRESKRENDPKKKSTQGRHSRGAFRIPNLLPRVLSAKD